MPPPPTPPLPPPPLISPTAAAAAADDEQVEAWARAGAQLAQVPIKLNNPYRGISGSAVEPGAGNVNGNGGVPSAHMESWDDDGRATFASSRLHLLQLLSPLQNTVADTVTIAATTIIETANGGALRTAEKPNPWRHHIPTPPMPPVVRTVRDTRDVVKSQELSTVGGMGMTTAILGMTIAAATTATATTAVAPIVLRVGQAQALPTLTLSSPPPPRSPPPLPPPRQQAERSHTATHIAADGEAVGAQGCACLTPALPTMKNKVKVKTTATAAAVAAAAAATVFVRNIPAASTERVVMDAFSSSGAIQGGLEGVTILPRKVGRVRYAFIRYQRARDAAAALKATVTIAGTVMNVVKVSRKTIP